MKSILGPCRGAYLHGCLEANSHVHVKIEKLSCFHCMMPDILEEYEQSSEKMTMQALDAFELVPAHHDQIMVLGT